MNELKDLLLLLKSRFPIVLVESHEEPRVLGLLEKITNLENLPLYTWSVTAGLRRRMRTECVAETSDLTLALRHIEKTVQNGVYVPTDWAAIIFNHVVWVRFPHMLLGAYLTTAFCVAAVGAGYLLKQRYRVQGLVMVRMSLALATVLVPLQIFFGHLTGDYIHDDQPAKFAAVEGRWVDEQPAAEVIIAIPDAAHERNRFEWKVPVLGSLIASASLDSREVGLTDFRRADRPPVLIPFFAFRVMAGCGVIMLALAWIGTAVDRRGGLENQRWLLWPLALSFPLGFIAVLAGWFTAEVGRQPWTVWGVLRTADALTPGLSPHLAATTFAMYVFIYAFIFCFGIYYILRIVRRGVFSGKVLTVWNGHVIAQTYPAGPQRVEAARSGVSRL